MKHIHQTFQSFKLNEERDEEYFDYQEETSKGELTKVTAIELENAVKRSELYVEVLNSLDDYARLYDKCKRLVKELENKKQKAKEDFIETANVLFEASDGVIKRVIETQNILVTITKHDPDEVNMIPNYKEALNYIQENYSDLSEIVNEAIDNTMQQRSSSPYLSSVDLKRRRGGVREYEPEDNDESVEESKKITEGLSDWISQLWNKIKNVFSSVDRNLNAAKSLVSK